MNIYVRLIRNLCHDKYESSIMCIISLNYIFNVGPHNVVCNVIMNYFSNKLLYVPFLSISFDIVSMLAHH